jgi:hypothetical protein
MTSYERENDLNATLLLQNIDICNNKPMRLNLNICRGLTKLTTHDEITRFDGTLGIYL